MWAQLERLFSRVLLLWAQLEEVQPVFITWKGSRTKSFPQSHSEEKDGFQFLNCQFAFSISFSQAVCVLVIHEEIPPVHSSVIGFHYRWGPHAAFANGHSWAGGILSIALLLVDTAPLGLEPDKVVEWASHLSMLWQVFGHLQRKEKESFSFSKLSIHTPLVACLGITLTTD